MQVGDPATYYIGSDSYAASVVKVTRCTVTIALASGRALTARATGRVDDEGRPVYQTSGGHGHVVVGYAIDYRDPSF